MRDDDPRIPAEDLVRFSTRFLDAMGCNRAVAAEVAEHLVDADLKGVYSHGTLRLPSYAKQADVRYFTASGTASLTATPAGAPLVDGGGGFGIPALRIAVEEGVALARQSGAAAIGVVNVGHTGRLGAFAEQAAAQDCLAIIFGGGARKTWRQVAPFGGAKGMLPTNPYAFGIPGGERGAVVLDFATAAGAGGKALAAKSAGRELPPDFAIDRRGQPTRDPDAYYDGGALLPMAGAKGYGMALLAEVMGEALLGAVKTEMNWICIFIDTQRYRAGDAYRGAAEAILQELRACPPAPGFDRVEIPGERERRIEAERREQGIPIAPATLQSMREAAETLGVESPELDRSNDGRQIA